MILHAKASNLTLATIYFYSSAGGTKDWDEGVCTSVCLFARMSQMTTRQSFRKFSVRVNCSRCSVLDDTVIRYVLPVLWMTSFLPIMANMATSDLPVTTEQNRRRSVTLRLPCSTTVNQYSTAGARTNRYL